MSDNYSNNNFLFLIHEIFFRNLGKIMKDKKAQLLSTRIRL